MNLLLFLVLVGVGSALPFQDDGCDINDCTQNKVPKNNEKNVNDTNEQTQHRIMELELQLAEQKNISENQTILINDLERALNDMNKKSDNEYWKLDNKIDDLVISLRSKELLMEDEPLNKDNRIEQSQNRTMQLALEIAEQILSQNVSKLQQELENVSTQFHTKISEIQRLLATMERNINETSEKRIMELESKLMDEFESKLQNQNDTIQLLTKISEMESKIQMIVCHDCDDCEDVRAHGHLYSGVYSVIAGNGQPMRVFCEMTSDGKAWTRILHRQDNLVDFTFKKWVDYEAGFGDPQGSHWMGLIMMNQLTTKYNYKLRVDLEDWEGETRYAEYTTFRVGAGSDKYRLTIGGYSGTAGNSMTGWHNNMMFTTIDQDNDQRSPGNCADGTGYYTGGWWYNRCFHARLTGTYLQGGDRVPYAHGIHWWGWRGNYYSYKVATMKVQRL